MPRDLETLRDTLWEIFEEAHERHNSYDDTKYGSSNNHKIQNRNAMANLGQAIVGIEQEIRLQDEAQNGLRLVGKAKTPANKG
ncbi:MAG TPA: hypothetical protein VHP34_00375 [Alphaproteobacteria bacterium]|jgi:hypothetical protein|nr:hypothetical protein [Alphaproteobacteria bacterium]